MGSNAWRNVRRERLAKAMPTVPLHGRRPQGRPLCRQPVPLWHPEVVPKVDRTEDEASVLIK